MGGKNLSEMDRKNLFMRFNRLEKLIVKNVSTNFQGQEAPKLVDLEKPDGKDNVEIMKF
jgi:hypothetical protein